MKEIIALLLIYLTFAFISFLFYKKMVSAKKIYLLLFIPVYFLFIYFYYAFVEQIHVWLREKGIYLEFGHASIALIELFLFSCLSGVAVIIFVFLKRNEISKKRNL